MQHRGSPFGTPPHQQQPELSPLHQLQMAAAAEAAPPINTLAPPPPSSSVSGGGGPGAAATGPSYDYEPPDEGGALGISGNRWPRQETLALLKIRSDMDAAFRDATLKAPLWDEVSRKLAELGYTRNAKKCKEKFENVHKYYKRTKEGRAGRQDGKSYRFFDQLEALHNTTSIPPTLLMSTAGTNPSNPPAVLPLVQPITTAPPPPQSNPENPTGISFSTNSMSSSGSDDNSNSDDEVTEEGQSGGGGRKRKRESRRGKMMAFFEGLMRQVMERQEAMQQRFLEVLEKREQDRVIRDEAWRRQEMARMTREHELAVQERAAAASRDAAIISFMQKVTGQTVHLPPSPSTGLGIVQSPPPPSQPSIHQATPPQPPQVVHQKQKMEVIRQPKQPPPPPAAATSAELVPVAPSAATQAQLQEGTTTTVTGMNLEPTSSRWPKSEVHALIKIRSALDSRYQESGPKGPLWEEISSEMKKLGYNRSSKRCKEKWENINKYFKKVKESNKKRPEDAKTCPYFHQLDALHRSKLVGGSTGGAAVSHPAASNQSQNPSPISVVAPALTQPPPSQTQQHQGDQRSTGKNGDAERNGGIATIFSKEGSGDVRGGDNSSIMKKPEDIMKELMGQSNDSNNYNSSKLDEGESDNMDIEDDEDDEDMDDEDGNGQYRIQYQRQNVGNNGTAAAPPMMIAHSHT